MSIILSPNTSLAVHIMCTVSKSMASMCVELVQGTLISSDFRSRVTRLVSITHFVDVIDSQKLTSCDLIELACSFKASEHKLHDEQVDTISKNRRQTLIEKGDTASTVIECKFMSTVYVLCSTYGYGFSKASGS